MEIIAHRGASFAAPENTLAAARLAWTEGADALECDVRLTADGKLAVIHDADTFRVAGVVQKVARTPMAELARLDVGRWKDPRYLGEKIPELGAVLVEMPAEKRIFIELKTGPETVSALKSCLDFHPLPARQMVVISFDFDVAAAAKKTFPLSTVGWIQENPARFGASLDKNLQRCRDVGLDAVDLEAGRQIDSLLVDRVHAAGLKFYCWTVDDPTLARRLVAAGVDGLTTNRPGWLRAQLLV